jgi:hypothetical protein
MPPALAGGPLTDALVDPLFTVKYSSALGTPIAASLNNEKKTSVTLRINEE